MIGTYHITSGRTTIYNFLRLYKSQNLKKKISNKAPYTNHKNESDGENGMNNHVNTMLECLSVHFVSFWT